MKPLRLTITETAENDLADIWAFIADGSEAAASNFVHQIGERFEPLRHHPDIGPSREYLAPGLRVHFHGRYAIYYVYDDTELTIVRVVHGSRDIADLFSGDE